MSLDLELSEISFFLKAEPRSSVVRSKLAFFMSLREDEPRLGGSMELLFMLDFRALLAFETEEIFGLLIEFYLTTSFFPPPNMVFGLFLFVFLPCLSIRSYRALTNYLTLNLLNYFAITQIAFATTFVLIPSK